MENLKQIAEHWFEAFNAHDLDKLLALYADDAKHYSPKLRLRRPETKGWIGGKRALSDWWEDAFKRLPHLRYEPKHILTGDGMVFMEYKRVVPGEQDLMVGEVLEVNSLGRIVYSRVYHG